ncbi:hypothetical protein ACTUM2_15005, partial [Listeria monocytogenes]|uniref:hypothetical protein n=1 Tax=Listeria monocytogenes TaxID=1639 RepID=UPI003FA49EBA
WGSVVVLVNILILKKVSIFGELQEVVLRQKDVVEPFDLIVPRLPCRPRDNPLDPRVRLLPGIDDGVFADSAWAAEDEEPSLVHL